MLDAGIPTTETACAARPRTTTGANGATPAILPTERVGRFEVQRCIGMGGMGQVYAAHDPQLGRTVALKVLHADRDRRQDPRLVREAQALARLSHPNVVAIHDVGVHEGRLFLAMEFVEGMTLRAWLQRQQVGSPGHVAWVLDVLIQAGRGLAAAHRAGLVHRDFKPGNVLLGKDGRVRVADFGLVRVAVGGAGGAVVGAVPLGHRSVAGSRQVGQEVADGREGDAIDADLWGLLDERPLTQPGALVGTPAYMAPEQLLGERVDASTDQFGFCLTVWEAIFGVRAFPGKSIPEVARRMRWWRPVRPNGVACPQEVELALRKGLAFGRSRRHRSMEALLEMLERARTALAERERGAPQARRRWPVALAFCGGLAAMVAATSPQERSPCSGAEENLVGVWDEATRAELQRAFLQTGRQDSAHDWERFEREFGEYVRQWQAGYHDACEATRVRREQSVELMHLRMACLDTRRQAMARVVEGYLRTEEPGVERLVEAVGHLKPVTICADIDYVRRRTRQ